MEKRLIESYKKKREAGENVDNFYRREGMFHFGMLTAELTLDYAYQETSSGPIFVGKKTANVSGKAYGGGGGYYIPLAVMNDRAMTCIDYGMDILYIRFRPEEMRLNGGRMFTPDINILQFNVPVFFAYKSGTGASLRRSVKSGFTIGGGAALNVNLLDYDLSMASKLRATPFVLGELSFYTGFCWKVRGTAFVSKQQLINMKTGVGGYYNEDNSHMLLQARPAFMLSLVYQTFSKDWED